MRRLIPVLVIVFVVVTPLPAHGSEDFTIEVFPHADPDVRFGNDWGDPRPGGRSHRGTDIFSPKGSPVLAVADGFVEYMEDWPTAGYALIIRHAGGWSSHYYHLDNDTPGTDDGQGGWDAAFAAGLAVGDFVFAGQVVAYVGDSGNAEPSSPHTHFELRVERQAVNPFVYLAEAYTRDQLLSQLAEIGIPVD